MNKVVLSFPGLGIGEFSLNPVAFTLFGKFEVRWYGLLITLGMVLAFLYVMWRAKKSEGVKPDDVIDVGLVTIVLSIICARLYYVLTSLDQYHSFYDVIAVWNGGLAVYGGVLGGALGIFIVCRIKKRNALRLYDATVPAVILAQAIGRWGNFFNGEAYGYEITSEGTTRFFFFLKEFSLPAGEGTFFHWIRMGLGNAGYYHPTFFYESVWNLLGFLLLNLLYRKKKFNGQILLSYLAWYGFGRMFIEGLRTDSLYIFKGIFGTEGVRISQLVGLLCFLAGTVLLILIPILRKKNPALAVSPIPAADLPSEPTETPAEPEQPEAPAETPVEKPAEKPVEKSAEEPVEEPLEAPAELPEEPKQPEEPAEEPLKPAPKPRRKPANQRGTVTLPPKAKKRTTKKTTSNPGGTGHADH